MTPTIGLMGDVMLGRGVAAVHARGSPEDLWSEALREVTSECDLLVCNLECCISDRGHRTDLVTHKPFFFRAPPAGVAWLQAIGAGAVGLANNHALDFGEEALLDTLRHLEEGGVAFAGAGAVRDQARSGVVAQAGGLRVGLLAVSDHPPEFAATPDTPGIAYAELTNPAPGWILDELARLRERCDLVIAFPHWGPNMTLRPARWQRERAAEFLAAGADLVAGHSAHVFHGIERAPDGLLLYDLGDAIDDYVVDPDLRNDLGILVVWRPGATPDLELVGLRIESFRTRLATGADADWIAARLDEACGELQTGVRRVGEQRFEVD
jgi:poly-gamma-glutamate capsule biosynthesis protein CapA/YwtB (metallophosphatase superfamily)